MLVKPCLKTTRPRCIGSVAPLKIGDLSGQHASHSIASFFTTARMSDSFAVARQMQESAAP